MFYTHLCWFVVLSSMFLASFLMSLFVTLSKVSFYVSLNIFHSWFFDFDLVLTFDWMSCWFMSVVLIISSVISVYSFFYMSPYFKSSVFMWTTFLFISSMLLVICVSNLFYTMLGWDGLGLVSFLLIVFYQNTSSITSGLFTILINRIGDGFFLASLALCCVFLPDFFSMQSFVPSQSILTLFMVITFMTNSALYPFSSWLPMAMAAPTPISALVHSSTLVTAGLYLIMRFSYVLYSNSQLMMILLVVSLFTSFYAGLNTLFEIDLNKLIALSTLSHLGFISMSFSCGLLSLSFFHLLTHALFKSLLFMCIGDIIINLNHSQDIRFLSSGVHYTPFSVYTMYVSLLNLLGMPNMSGFFSNDLVLEAFHYSSSSSLLLFLLYFNVFFTYFYTFQLFYYSFSSNNMTPFFIHHAQSSIHVGLIFILGLFSVVFGSFFMSIISHSIFFLVVPSSINMFPLVLNLAFFSYLCLFVSFPNFHSKLSFFFFSSMIALSPFLMSFSSFSYFNVSFMLVNDFELGFLNHLVHKTLVESLSSSINYFFFFYRFQPLYIILFCILVMILI